MAGRVSEESGEAFNGTNKIRKNVLSRMSSDKARIKKTTEREQGNLKTEVMNNTLRIKEKSEGKKRGTYKPRVRAVDDITILNIQHYSRRLMERVMWCWREGPTCHESGLIFMNGSREGRHLKIGWIVSMRRRRVVLRILIGRMNATAGCYDYFMFLGQNETYSLSLLFGNNL